ncbi:MAG: FeoB-associated Cys-rich membrane protein [Lachnospiraceae bacterium]|nr:FeoB-associated Cys-rich membrane protein [Lachnospiraceae bacterium]
MIILPLYIDVAVMSATIEAIVGVVIAVSAFLIIRFRKAKKKVQETLHLEDTKETEEDVVLLDDNAEKTSESADQPEE